MSRYDDLLHRSRPVPSRPRMSRQDRAKIFAPFAALSGHGEAVHAREQVLVPPGAPSEETEALLDRKLRALRRGEQVTVSYFLPLKQGPEGPLGTYVTVTDGVAKVDVHAQVLYLHTAEIPFAYLAALWT